MIMFSIYDRLSITQKDYIQSIDNLEILKRDMLSRYRKMLNDKDIVSLDKMKDINIIVYGEVKNGKLVAYSKDKIIDISLASFIGVSEVKKDVNKSN